MPLYHYTDLTAVVSILDNSSIRLTDINYLNDSSELHDGLNAIRTAIDWLENSNQIKDDAYLSSSLDQIKASFVVGETSFAEAVQLFTCSFSSTDDQLSQWRGYGPYCLEFDEEILSEHADLHKCTYNNREKKTLAQNIISAETHNISIALQDKERGFLGDATVNALAALLTKAATFKEEGFAEECETRWISWGGKPSTQYRVRGHQLIPFVTMTIPIECIRSIILGPMRDQALAERAMVSYIQDRGFNIDIRVSKIPFRTH